MQFIREFCILFPFFTAIWRQTEFISRMKRRRKVRTRKLLLSLYGKAAVIRITPRGKRQFNAGFVTVATVVLLASVLLTRRKIKFLPVTRLGAACFIAIRFKEIPRVEGDFIRQSSLDLSHLSFRVVSRKIPEVWHHPLGLRAIVKVKKCLLLHKNSFIFFFACDASHIQVDTFYRIYFSIFLFGMLLKMNGRTGNCNSILWKWTWIFIGVWSILFVRSLNKG